MFDFFGDVIQWLNGATGLVQWLLDTLARTLGAFRGVQAVAQVLDTLTRLPPEIGALGGVLIGVMVFDFIRGR